MKDTVKVSVIMSVFNGAEYLEDAMEGILKQTWKNWECIVVDDCSADDTGNILDAYAGRDSRIRVIHNKSNRRLAASLNIALKEASGKYILRMDADDICRRDRMEKQVAYMEEHPELAMSSCRFFTLCGEDIQPAVLHRRGDAEAAEALFLFFEPILHPGVIAVRKEMDAFCYDPAYSCTEDLELWTRMLAAHKKLAIQEDYLMIYRIHDKQITVTKKQQQKEQYREIISRFYRERMFPITPGELEVLTDGIYFRDIPVSGECFQFINKVRHENRVSGKMACEAVDYAAFEVLMAYRGEGCITKKTFLGNILSFSLLFLVREYFRRKGTFRRSKKLYLEAIQIFGL